MLKEADRKYVRESMDVVVTGFGADDWPDHSEICRVTLFDPITSTFHRGWSFVSALDMVDCTFKRGADIALGRAFAAYKRFTAHADDCQFCTHPCDHAYSASPILRPEILELMDQFLEEPFPKFKSQAKVQPAENEMEEFRRQGIQRLKLNVRRNLNTYTYTPSEVPEYTLSELCLGSDLPEPLPVTDWLYREIHNCPFRIRLIIC